jgi:hypothetical protein
MLQTYQFTSGTKYSYLDKVVRPKDGEEFKIGDLVSWDDPDVELDREGNFITEQTFQGKIDSIFLIEHKYGEFEIEVSINNPRLGRLELNEIEKVSEL